MPEIESIALIALAFALGGILKGATGAGAPVLAVPLLAVLYDVPLAVAVFILPSLASNFWQAWHHRKDLLPIRFAGPFAAAGATGAAVGSVLLVGLPSQALTTLVAVVVLAYVAFRLFQPAWVLAMGTAVRIAVPVGLVAGVMQGATGVSAPVSITFLNAMRLGRLQFIATISLLFSAFVLVQLPLLVALGVLTFERAIYGLLAIIPLFGFMPVGAYLGKRISKVVFDRVILALLVLLAIRLLWELVG